MNRWCKEPFPGTPHWIGVTALLLIVAGWIALEERFSVAWNSLAPTAALFVLSIFVAAGRTSRSTAGRLIDQLRVPAVGIAFVLLGFLGLRFLNHLVMSLPVAMADNWLAALDQRIGFDWLAYANFVAQRPGLVALFYAAYTGLNALAVAALFVLFVLGRNDRAREYIELTLTTGVVCILIAAMFPAEAAMARYATPEMRAIFGPHAGVYHLEHLSGLRSGVAHVFDAANLPGLATFPSFHTAAALIMLYSLRGMGWFFWGGATYAAVMIAATPIMGGHYFVDLIAGTALMLAIVAVREFVVKAGAGKVELLPQS